MIQGPLYLPSTAVTTHPFWIDSHLKRLIEDNPKGISGDRAKHYIESMHPISLQRFDIGSFAAAARWDILRWMKEQGIET